MSKIKRRTDATIVARPQFEFGAFCEGRRARFVLSGGIQNLFQGQKIGLGDQHPGLAVSSTRLGPVSWDHGLTLNVELQAETRDAGSCPTPHRGLADAPNDLCGLTHVEVKLAVTVGIGRELFHPATQRNFEDESNRNPPVPADAVNQHPYSQADGFFD